MIKINLVRCLVRHKDKYLLLKRAEDNIFPDNVGKWECPGGRVEPNENPEHTALRELKEEAGLEGRIVKELPELQMNDDRVQSKCRVYLVEINSNQVRLSEEHSDFLWLAPEEVKEKELVKFASLLLEYFNNPSIYLTN
jgi:8-oxo-dGTP diphosphatase